MEPCRENRLIRNSAKRRRATSLQPYLQGELDGLCAIYSVINGLRLLLADQRPLSRLECTTLFSIAVDHLSAKGQLKASAALGLGYRTWYGLTTRMCRAASELAGLKIKTERPFAGRRHTAHERIMRLMREATDKGWPVLAATSDHFTVIASCTQHRLQLFDSSHCHWFAIAGCRTSGVWTGRGHFLAPHSLTVLSIDLPTRA